MNQALVIGDQLLRGREAMGLSLAQAAERLHVDPAIIEALETGRFIALGAPVFVRGHLRRYAELVGAPEAQLQAQYAAMQEASAEPDLTRGPHLPVQPRRDFRIRWQLVVLTLLLVVAAVAWWALRVKTS
jgi:cytoskeleton protein RodZ